MLKGFLVFSLLSLVVFADEELSQVLSRNTYEPNFFAMLFGLFLVVGLIYVTGFIYQKLIRVKIDTVQNDSNIKIQSAVSLGQNKALYIVKTDNKRSLIAATQNSITFIRDLDDEPIK